MKSTIVGALILIFSITSLYCGGGPRKEAKSDVTDELLERRTSVSKHRAFDHFSKGDLYERSGNLEKAADEYRLALFYDPDSDELKRSLGRVLYDLNRYDEALDIMLRLNKPTIDDKLMLAACYNNAGALNKAIEIYEKMAETDSVPQIVVENLAEYYTVLKNKKKVEKYYDWLIENAENDKLWRSEKASAYVQIGETDEAVKIYDEMMRTDSLDYGAWLGMAAVQVYLGNYEEASGYYRYVIDRNWDNAQMLSMILPAIFDINDLELASSVAKRIAELYPDDYLSQRRYAILLFTEQEYDKADSVFSYILSAVDNDPVASYYRGRIAHQAEDYSRAEEFYIEAVAHADTMSEAWLNLAFVRGLMDNHESAMATFDTTLAKVPGDSIRILFFTGSYLSTEQKFEEAVDYYERVLNSDQEQFDVRFNLAAAYERTGRFNDAEALFLELLEEDDENPVVLNYLGYMYADMGIKLNKAEKLIKKALEKDPDNGAYLDSYAWVLYKKGKYEEALEYQRKALEADTEDAVLYEHMGDIYYALNQPAQAYTHWEKALELDPDNIEIKEKLNR